MGKKDKGTTHSTTDSQESWKHKLRPGDVVRVTSKSGNPIEATIVLVGRDEAGLYVRLPDGRLARLLPERVNWKTLEKVGVSNPVAKGDEVVVVALGGTERRGRLTDPHLDDRITVALPKGATYSVPLGQTETNKFRLLFPTDSLRRGDEFLVRSFSGTEYRGRALRVDKVKILARLRTPHKGKDVTLKVEHLDLRTLHVLIPVLGSAPSGSDTLG
jgi:hypothetical protein